MAEKEYIITLVRSAQGGDSASFAELYNLYYQKVFAFIRTIVRNSADAEDILQLTFLNAWRNLEQLSDPAAFNTWIQVIARNLSTSHCPESVYQPPAQEKLRVAAGCGKG